MLLSGTLVVDVTNRFGWLAGRILADLGADVVKLDPPGADRNSPAWRGFNVNKRALDLDPDKPADRLQIEALLSKADICLLTPGSLDSGVSLDPDDLRQRYPRLVVVAITPFGRVGPRRAWRATDLEVMASGGAMFLAGEPDGAPTRVSEPQSFSWTGG